MWLQCSFRMYPVLTNHIFNKCMTSTKGHAFAFMHVNHFYQILFNNSNA